MSPAVPPLATVTTIAFLPPGSGMQIVPPRSAGEIRYGSPEIDCEAGTVSRELRTTAFATARLQAIRGTASTSPSLAHRPDFDPVNGAGRSGDRAEIHVPPRLAL